CLDRWIGPTENHSMLPVKERTELFAKFIAYDKLQHYLLEQIGLLWEIERAHPQGLRSKQLHWTGDICNLVELVYGLYETKQINNGDVSLTEVVNCMEQLFQINLGRVNRIFIDIRRRKVVSHTRFMEQMRTAILHRIDQSDAYIPQSFRQGYARQ
ncbi:MAG TPA: RteC domain-containing protein, partial [Mucilaginibacter sp.]